MDGPRDYRTKWSKTKTKIMWYHLYVESKKTDTNKLIYKIEIDSDIENKLMVSKGDSGKGLGDKLGGWD